MTYIGFPLFVVGSFFGDACSGVVFGDDSVVSWAVYFSEDGVGVVDSSGFAVFELAEAVFSVGFVGFLGELVDLGLDSFDEGLGLGFGGYCLAADEFPVVVPPSSFFGSAV